MNGNSYTHDEVKALRYLARNEILDEMEKKYLVREDAHLSPTVVEDRVKTYIMAGLKP